MSVNTLVKNVVNAQMIVRIPRAQTSAKVTYLLTNASMYAKNAVSVLTLNVQKILAQTSAKVTYLLTNANMYAKNAVSVLTLNVQKILAQTSAKVITNVSTHAKHAASAQTIVQNPSVQISAPSTTHLHLVKIP